MSACSNKHLSSIILTKTGTTFPLLSGRDQQHLARTSGSPPPQHLASQTPENRESINPPMSFPLCLEQKQLLNKLFE